MGFLLRWNLGLIPSQNGLLGSYSAAPVGAPFQSKERCCEMGLFSTLYGWGITLLSTKIYSTFYCGFLHYLLKEYYLFTSCRMMYYSTFCWRKITNSFSTGWGITLHFAEGMLLLHFLQDEFYSTFSTITNLHTKTLKSKESSHQVDVSSQHVSAHCGHNGRVATQFLQWFRNHIYSVLSRNDPFNLTTRDLRSEFRYGFGKVLGTQNCPTLGLASSHCILCLNPIKAFQAWFFTIPLS